MIEILLFLILMTLLLPIHAKEKNTGRYGQLYVFLKKRVLRYLRRKTWQGWCKAVSEGKTAYCKAKDKIKEV